MLRKFDQVYVTNTNSGKAIKADVLEHSDKAMKVALVGTTMSLFLKRTDVSKPYIGIVGSMEFTTTGELI